MSVIDYADFLNIGKTCLQAYLNGGGNPRLDTMILIAEKLEISLEELLIRNGEDSSSKGNALSALSEEIAQLHPEVQATARQQLLALQYMYDLSDCLTVAEHGEDVPP